MTVLRKLYAMPLIGFKLPFIKNICFLADWYLEKSEGTVPNGYFNVTGVIKYTIAMGYTGYNITRIVYPEYSTDVTTYVEHI